MMILAFFFIGSLLFYEVLFRDSVVRDFLKSNWVFIFGLVIIGLISKYPYEGFFFGLEYEDAYIYQATARHIYEGVNISSFTTESNVLGSLKESLGTSSSPHPIGFSYIIYLFCSFFGYSFFMANIVSLVFSVLNVVNVILLASFCMSKRSAVLCGFIYTTIPILNVFSSTAFSDPFSNFYLTALCLICVLIYKSKENSIFNYFVLFLVMGSVVLIKRENLILILLSNVLLIFNCLLATFKTKGKEDFRKVIGFGTVSLTIFLFYTFKLEAFQTIDVEDADISQSSFYLPYFPKLFLAFIDGYCTFAPFLFYTTLFVVGVLQCFRNKVFFYVTAVFFSFIFTYSVHYRSYYFVEGFTVHYQEMIRYMINFISFYCIIVAKGWEVSLNYFRKITKMKNNHYLSTCLLVTIFGISFQYTANIRRDYLEDESFSRFATIRKTLSLISEKDHVVITEQVLLYQIFGSNELNLADALLIKGVEEYKLVVNLAVRKKKGIIYIELKEGIIDIDRFPSQFITLKNIKKNLIFEDANCKVFKLSF